MFFCSHQLPIIGANNAIVEEGVFPKLYRREDIGTRIQAPSDSLQVLTFEISVAAFMSVAHIQEVKFSELIESLEISVYEAYLIELGV